jgi:hypothetical protein
VTPGSPSSPSFFLVNLALQETPPEKLCKMRKAPEDCHVLISWSLLQNLVKQYKPRRKPGNLTIFF